MARYRYPARSDMSERTQQLLAQIPPANVFRMMGYMDRIASPVVKLGSELLYKGSLDPVLRELVIVRVGYLSGAQYEIDQHEAIARQLGATEEELLALRPLGNRAALSPAKLAVIEFTDRVVKEVRVSDALFESVSRFINEPQMCELIICIGYYMMICRFLEVLQIDGEADQMLTDLPVERESDVQP